MLCEADLRTPRKEDTSGDAAACRIFSVGRSPFCGRLTPGIRPWIRGALPA